MEKCRRCKQDMPCTHEFIFRFEQCLDQYLSSKHKMGQTGDILSGTYNGIRKTSPTIWSHPGIEYIADFESVGRRALVGKPVELIIFKYHFLKEWNAWGTLGKLAAAAHRTDPVVFWETVKAMKIALGRAFSELKPYPLYPAAGYMRQSQSDDNPVPTVTIEEARNSGMELAGQIAKNIG